MSKTDIFVLPYNPAQKHIRETRCHFVRKTTADYFRVLELEFSRFETRKMVINNAELSKIRKIKNFEILKKNQNGSEWIFQLKLIGLLKFESLK